MIEWDYSLEAVQLFDFVTLIAGFFSLLSPSFYVQRVNHPPLASTNKEGPQEQERESLSPSPPSPPSRLLFLPLAAAHLSAEWLMKHVTHLSSLMSLSLRPDFNADLVEKTSQWKRGKQLAAQPWNVCPCHMWTSVRMCVRVCVSVCVCVCVCVCAY